MNHEIIRLKSGKFRGKYEWDERILSIKLEFESLFAVSQAKQTDIKALLVADFPYEIKHKNINKERQEWGSIKVD